MLYHNDFTASRHCVRRDDGWGVKITAGPAFQGIGGVLMSLSRYGPSIQGFVIISLSVDHTGDGHKFFPLVDPVEHEIVPDGKLPVLMR